MWILGHSTQNMELYNQPKVQYIVSTQFVIDTVCTADTADAAFRKRLASHSLFHEIGVINA
jgi:hypothetical protein